MEVLDCALAVKAHLISAQQMNVEMTMGEEEDR